MVLPRGPRTGKNAKEKRIMSTRIQDRFRTLPTPMAGLALGVSSLGVLLELALPLHHWAQYFFALVGLFFWGLLATRYVLYPKSLLEELKHPVVGSVIPAFTMALMIMSVTIRQFSWDVGVGLWGLGVLLHLMAVAVFIYNRIKEASLEVMVPSWFVGPVGIIIADLTFPQVAWLHPLAYVLLVIGMVAYAILLPMMLMRLVFRSTIPRVAQPTLAIMAAPAPMCLAGYLTVVQDVHWLLVAFLFGVSVLMTFFIYLCFFRLLKLQFSPAYSAFTFPMVSSAMAMYKLADRVAAEFPAAAGYAAQIRDLADFETVVAVVIILFVTYHYVKNLPGFFAPKCEMIKPAEPAPAPSQEHTPAAGTPAA